MVSRSIPLQLWPNLKWPNKLVVDCGRHLHPTAVKRDSIKCHFTLPVTSVLSRLSRVSNNHPWDRLRLAFLLRVIVVVVVALGLQKRVDEISSHHPRKERTTRCESDKLSRTSRLHQPVEAFSIVLKSFPLNYASRFIRPPLVV